ncbi:MAG: hypothetical protein KDA42_12475 [Planctomycetales bacterium]|nr:hypothetical protein [Planctomycetales bacterium]
MIQIFLAGIMQGSHLGEVLHNQDYRGRLRRILEEKFPEASIYDPLADHGNSLEYDAQRGREVFLRHNAMCAEVDVLIAFVPEASMGTAIEMWQAHQHGRLVITISPLEHNWAVRFLSDQVYRDVEAFEAALQNGQIAQLIDRHTARE